MSTKVAFAAVAVLIVLLPWLAWRHPAVRRVAPLAVVQILFGVLLGPSCFGRLAPGLHGQVFTPPVLGLLDGVAFVGVLLYVFVTGMHLDAAALRQEGRRLGWIASGSILVPLLLGAAAGAWLSGGALNEGAGPDGTWNFTASVAICTAVTALPVLAAVLQETGILGTRLGQAGLAVAALNDLALWLMLAVLLALSATADAMQSAGLLAAVVGWVAFMLLVARPLLARLAATRRETALIPGVALAILSAGLSEALGTGYLIGAFLAGIIIPPSSRTALVGQLEAVTATVLLPFFFMSTGLKAFMEPDSTGFVGAVALVTGATILGKVVGTAVPAAAAGFTWRESLALGAMMQTKGLMEVVVLAVLHDAGLIGRGVFSAMVAMAIICTVLTAPALRWLGRNGEGRAACPRQPVTLRR